MSDKIYFSTGELAKMLEITKQTLIYYDKIGLISPAKRGEKDYRYYTLEQADELDSILTFRNLGVPIGTLKAYLKERDAKSCIKMLNEQKKKVDEEIQKLDRIRKKIEARAKLLESISKVSEFNQIQIRWSEKEVYMVEKCEKFDEKTYMKSFIKLCNASKKFHIDFENPVCNIIKRKDIVLGNYNRVSYFGISVGDRFKEASLAKIEKPAGIYASTYHHGPYENMYISYNRLLESIKKEKYEICGDAYETDLLSTLTNADRDEYMKLISVQVCKI